MFEELELTGYEAAAEAILARWTASGHQVLRLEGFAGAGKSTIASLIQTSRQDVVVIRVDDFEHKTTQPTNYDTIIERIDVPSLRQRAADELAVGGPVIFEGVCLEDLLPAGEFGNGFNVYVKRLDPMWHSGSYIGKSDTAEDPLTQEILVYHEKRDRLLHAGLVVAVNVD